MYIWLLDFLSFVWVVGCVGLKSFPVWVCFSGLSLLCNLVSINNRCIELDSCTQTKEKRHEDQLLMGNDTAVYATSTNATLQLTPISYIPPQKHWNSKANCFVFAKHWRELGLNSKAEYDAVSFQLDFLIFTSRCVKQSGPCHFWCQVTQFLCKQKPPSGLTDLIFCIMIRSFLLPHFGFSFTLVQILGPLWPLYLFANSNLAFWFLVLINVLHLVVWPLHSGSTLLGTLY